MIIKNARIVTPYEVIESGSISIREGRIDAVSPGSLSADETASVIDVDGAVVFPGFIDVHIHGAVGVDTLNATADDLGKMGEFLVTQGVTSWVPTVVPGTDDEYCNFAGAVKGAMERPDQGARPLGVHYEGPFVNSMQCGALHTQYFKSYSTPEDFSSLAHEPGWVKLITLAPEIEGGIALIKELTTRGWVVSIGHTRADLETLGNALNAGARHMTHFMNAMPPLHHRNPGPIGWGLSEDKITFDVIADGVHLDKLILKLLLKLKGSDSITLISDSIAAAGKGDGDYDIWGETIAVKEGRTSNASGSIAGSVITMLDAVKMMKSLGVSDVEIARMSSSNPAKLLGVETELGSIEVGKRADLVVIASDGNVKLTIVGGEVVFRS